MVYLIKSSTFVSSNLKKIYDMKSRIKELLKSQGLTISELATMIGTTQTSVSRMLSDDGNPTYDTLVKIANALNVEIQDLFSNDKNILTCPKCGARFRLEE